jgi:hypothetical protein
VIFRQKKANFFEKYVVTTIDRLFIGSINNVTFIEEWEQASRSRISFFPRTNDPLWSVVKGAIIANRFGVWPKQWLLNNFTFL